MNEHDDTKTRTVYHVASTPDGGHFVARTEDGKLVQGMTYEHAAEHHPEALEAPGVEFVTLAPPALGPAEARPTRTGPGGIVSLAVATRGKRDLSAPDASTRGGRKRL